MSPSTRTFTTVEKPKKRKKMAKKTLQVGLTPEEHEDGALDPKKRASIEDLKKGWGKNPIKGVVAVCSHANAHWDELVANTALVMRGEEKFPGIGNAPLSVMTQEVIASITSDTKKEDTFWRLLQMGYLMVGTGGGPFDEHQGGGKGKSAASMVAEFLGIDQEVGWRKLLVYTNLTDNLGDNPTWAGAEVGQVVKGLMPAQEVKNFWRVISRLPDEEAEDYTQRFLTGFGIRIKTFIDFEALQAQEAGELIAGGVQYITLHKGGEYPGVGIPRLAIVRSDSDMALETLVKMNQGDTCFFLQLRSNGQFFVMPMHKDARRNMADVASALRSLVAYRTRIGTPHFKTLLYEGTIPEAPGIYFDSGRSKGVYNGSLTQPDTPGIVKTAQNPKGILAEKEVIDLVLTAVEENYWPEKTVKECSGGSCPAHGGKGYKCPLFHMNLHRCRKNRFNMAAAEGKVKGVGEKAKAAGKEA